MKSWLPQPKRDSKISQHRHCMPLLGTSLCPVCTGNGSEVLPGHTHEFYCMECDLFWTIDQPLPPDVVARIQRREDIATNKRDHMQRVLRSLQGMRLTNSWMNY